MPRSVSCWAMNEIRACPIGLASIDVRVDDWRSCRVSVWFTSGFRRKGEFVFGVTGRNIKASGSERIGATNPAQIALRNAAGVTEKCAQE